MSLPEYRAYRQTLENLPKVKSRVELGIGDPATIAMERDRSDRLDRLAQLRQSYRIVDAQIKQKEAEVDRRLALPPLPFDSNAERDRLRSAPVTSACAVPFTGNATPKAVQAKRKRRSPRSRVVDEKAAPVETETGASKDARKALGLLTIGKSLLASGKTDKAADRFRRIIADYPKTPAAAGARVLLADLE